MNKRWITAGAVLVLLTIVSLGAWYWGKDEPTALRVGDKAPNFVLADLEGNEVELHSLRGSVVVLTFWSTWCSTCPRDLLSLNLLYQGAAHEPFEILAVGVDQEGLPVVRRFAERKELVYTVLADPQEKTAAAYRRLTLPQTFLIDQTGVIRHIATGSRDWTTEANMNHIRNLLHSAGAPSTGRPDSGGTLENGALD